MGATKEQIKAISVEKIQASKTNPRSEFDLKELKDLAASIKEHGILQPLIVRSVNSHYEIIAGERRFKAAKQLDLKNVPCVVKKVSDEEALEIQIIENLQRADLNPMEEASSYNRLINKNHMNIEDVAASVGKSKAFVYGRLNLLTLPAKLQDALREGSIPVSWGVEVLKVIDETTRKEVVENILDNRYSDINDLGASVRKRLLFLKAAPFKINEKKPGDKFSCVDGCSNNTSKQTDLFDNVGKEAMCLDYKCWYKKKAAAREAMIKEFTDKKIQVLTGKKAEEVTAYDSEWVRADGYCSVSGAHGTYGENLKGEDMQFAMFINKEGDLERIFNKKQADLLIKEQQRLLKRKAAGKPAVKDEAEILKARKERKDKKIRKIAKEEILKEAIKYVSDSAKDMDVIKPQVLRIVVGQLVGVSKTTSKTIANTLGLKAGKSDYGGEDWDGPVIRFIAAATAKQLHQVLLLFAVGSGIQYFDEPEPTEGLDLLMSELKFDFKGEMKLRTGIVEERLETERENAKAEREKAKTAGVKPKKKKEPKNNEDETEDEEEEQ